MKITKRQLRRIIREAMPKGGVPDVMGAIGGGKFQPRQVEWASLSSDEQAQLRSEYEADPDSPRYKRVIHTSMADAMYGTSGSVVLDQDRNVRLMFTYQRGSGGSLGT